MLPVQFGKPAHEHVRVAVAADRAPVIEVKGELPVSAHHEIRLEACAGQAVDPRNIQPHRCPGRDLAGPVVVREGPFLRSGRGAWRGYLPRAELAAALPPDQT